MTASDSTPTFRRLSAILTGEPNCDPLLSAAYEKVLVSAAGEENVGALLREFESLEAAVPDSSEVAKQLFADHAVGDVAKQLTILWFVGGIKNPVANAWNFASAEHYFRGLVWSAIGGHPPGLSGGYSGHWRYPAE